MKYLSWITLLIFAAGSQLFAKPQDHKFAGEWVTNIGTVDFEQHGNKVTGTIVGYGGFWNQPLEAKALGHKATFTTTFLGVFTLVLDGDQFVTESPDLHVCGIRSSVTSVLQDGCGFSDKWIVAPSAAFPAGTYMLLTQTAGGVTGDVYDANDQIVDFDHRHDVLGQGLAHERVDGPRSGDLHHERRRDGLRDRVRSDPHLAVLRCERRTGQRLSRLLYLHAINSKTPMTS